MKTSEIIFIGSFFTAMLFESLALLYGISEWYTRGGFQGFVCITLWLIGMKVFMTGHDISKMYESRENTELWWSDL